MAARSRATAGRSRRSRATSAASGSARTLRDAVNEFVGALPLGRLAQRLTSVEGTVSRLEREVRRLIDAAGRGGGGGRRTATSPASSSGARTTRKAADGRRKSATAGGAAARKTAAAGGGRATRTSAAAGGRRTAAAAAAGGTAKKATPRRAAASGGRAAAAKAPARRRVGAREQVGGDQAQGMAAAGLDALTERSEHDVPAPLQSPAVADVDSESASQDLSVFSSPEGPGPMPAV